MKTIKSPQILRYLVLYVGLQILFQTSFSIYYSPSVSSSWSNRVSYKGAELEINALSTYGTGLAFSYQTGSINRYNKTKKNILEISPGINYIFQPDNYLNLRLRTNFRIKIPLTYGFQYNHMIALEKEKFSRQSFELLIGFAEYSVYSFESMFWKFLVGYDIELNSSDIQREFSPLRIHFCLGYNFSL